MKINCRHCGREFNYEESPFRPFCGKRCRMIDLGAWINEEYRMACVNGPKDEENDQQSEEE